MCFLGVFSAGYETLPLRRYTGLCDPSVRLCPVRTCAAVKAAKAASAAAEVASPSPDFVL
eukprot:SAG11_NODE_7267_length_1168_cov_1.566885_1_plen_59_part_10